MAELARYKRPEDEMLPGVGRPVVNKLVPMDTGAQYGPSITPFVAGGMRQQGAQEATSSIAHQPAQPSQPTGMSRRQVVPTQVGSEGGMISVNLTPEDRQLKSNLQQIDQMLASGVRPTAEQAQRIQTIRQQAGFLRGGTDRVPVGPDGLPFTRGIRGQGGGLTAQFDSSVSPQSRQAFLEDPVRPTAQIDRFNANRGAGAGQGMRAARNAAVIIRPNILEPAPVGSRRMQREMAVQGLQNEQARENAIIQANTQRLGFRNQSEIAAAGDAIQADRNKLLSEELGMRKVGVEAQAELDRANAKVAGVPKITPHFGEIESVTKDGITQTPYVVVPDGKGGFRQVTPTQGGTAPPAVSLSADQKAKAVAYAKANPKEDRTSILARIIAGEI